MTDTCLSLPGPPENYHHLKQLIASRQLSFPGQLDRIARFMLENPHVVAFESSRTLAERCGVSPTSVARFVRHLGFTDFRALKELFRSRVRELAGSAGL
jgi:DNA-binding MurR/RpiR family transcriptional regulator